MQLDNVDKETFFWGGELRTGSTMQHKHLNIFSSIEASSGGMQTTVWSKACINFFFRGTLASHPMLSIFGHHQQPYFFLLLIYAQKLCDVQHQCESKMRLFQFFFAVSFLIRLTRKSYQVTLSHKLVKSRPIAYINLLYSKGDTISIAHLSVSRFVEVIFNHYNNWGLEI